MEQGNLFYLTWSNIKKAKGKKRMKKLNLYINQIIFSIIFICTSTLAADLSTHSNNLTDYHTLREKSFSIQPGKNLNLEASFGDVLITTWDKAEVYVKILGNDKAEDKVTFLIHNDENEVSIKAESGKNIFNWFGNGPKMRFEIKVPTQFNTKVYTSGGDIKIGDVIGNNYLKTSGGDVTLRNTDGNLKVSTSGGDIKLYRTKGTMGVSTSGGDIRADEFAGNIDAETSGGDIYLNGKDASINAETSGGDITVKYWGSNKGIELHTSGGDINVSLPSDFNASANLSSSGGDVSCDFKGNNADKISDSKFRADINAGGNKLIAKTSGGSIRVRKN